MADRVRNLGSRDRLRGLVLWDRRKGVGDSEL